MKLLRQDGLTRKDRLNATTARLLGAAELETRTSCRVDDLKVENLKYFIQHATSEELTRHHDQIIFAFQISEQ